MFNLFKDLSLFASEDIFSPPSKQIKFSESTTETTKQKQPTVRTLLTSPVSTGGPHGPYLPDEI